MAALPKPFDADTTVSGDHTIPGVGGRHALHEADLLRKLTEAFHHHEGCERVSVVGVFRLEPADNEGCNWSSSLILDPAGTAPEVYALAYAAIIGHARQTWNLR